MFGVKYPDGSYSGALATSYASRYDATVYEVGGAGDPAARRQPAAPPWFPDDDVANDGGAKFGGG